jgi:hypothetical protein
MDNVTMIRIIAGVLFVSTGNAAARSTPWTWTVHAGSGQWAAPARSGKDRTPACEECPGLWGWEPREVRRAPPAELALSHVRAQP